MLTRLYGLLAACMVVGFGLLGAGCSPAQGVEQGSDRNTARARSADPGQGGAQTTPSAVTSRDDSSERTRRDRAPRTPEVRPEVGPDPAASAYRAIEETTSRIRGLKPGREVELRYMSQADLRQYFLDSFDREYTPDERARDQKLLSTLGLIRPDQDLATIMLSVLTEQVIGFYDEDTRRMYLVGDVVELTPSAKVTFSHEFTHALQDEFFNLKTFETKDNGDDAAAAAQALVEGDATLVMTLYAQKELSVDERRRYAQSQFGGPSAFDDAPLVVRQELLFPYAEGLRFVQTLYRQGGFPAVDAAFRDPPRSTAQIIHPEKYLNHEAPAMVSLPELAPALGPSWRQTVSNTLGELDVRILVEQQTDRQTAERAAAGWAGDRYALLEDTSGNVAVAIKTAWDSPREALEFFTVCGQVVRGRLGPGARQTIGEPSRFVLTSQGLAAAVAIREQEVLLVLAPDQTAAEALIQSLGSSSANAV